MLKNPVLELENINVSPDEISNQAMLDRWVDKITELHQECIDYIEKGEKNEVLKNVRKHTKSAMQRHMKAFESACMIYDLEIMEVKDEN